MKPQFILYVSNQDLSTEFYSKVLDEKPSLAVPGMTEFQLTSHAKLGLIPEEGIQRLLGSGFPPPVSGDSSAKSELYLLVNDAESFHARAIAHGARELSTFQRRDWGHSVAYSLDPDGYVLAFAQDDDA